MTIIESDSDMETVEDEGLLTRWSRRKHEAKSNRAGEGLAKAALDAPQELDAMESANGSVEAEEAEQYQPDDTDMPALESLDEDSDYSGFMSPKVSDGLRTLALRQLFRGSTFGVRDGLDDYDDDFTQFAKLGDVVTAEMRRQVARLKEVSDEELVEEVEGDQDDLVDESADLSAAEFSEQTVDLAGSEDVDEPLHEQKIKNEEITGNNAPGEKVNASKNS